LTGGEFLIRSESEMGNGFIDLNFNVFSV